MLHRDFVVDAPGPAQLLSSWQSHLCIPSAGTSNQHEKIRHNPDELIGSYPVTDEHGSIYYQLLAFKHQHPASPPPLVLNFDPHHDFYEDSDLSTIAVLSGCWGRPVTELGLGHVYTVLPSLISGNMGGFGQHAWCAPQVVVDPDEVRRVDFQSQLTAREQSDQFCNLHDLWIQPARKETSLRNNLSSVGEDQSHPPIPFPDSANCRIQDYQGPIWLSIDYDFFSLRGYYHHNLREVVKEFRTLTKYLGDNGIRPTEILGYRSRDYLSLYSGEKQGDRWIARVDECLGELRSDLLSKNAEPRHESSGRPLL